MLQVKNLILYIILTLSALSWFILTQNILLGFLVTFALIGIYFLPKYLAHLEYGILALFLLTPLSIDVSIIGGVKLSIPTEVLTLLLFLVFLLKLISGFQLHKQILKHPITLLLLIDVSWSFISAINSEFQTISLKRAFLKLVFLMVYYLIVSQFLHSNKSQIKQYWYYILGFLAPILYTFYQHSFWNFSQPTSVKISQPFYIDHTIYAACIAFLIPFLFLNIALKEKLIANWKVLLITTLFLLALYFSYSRAAWISLIFSGGYYVLVKFKVKFWQLTVLLVIVGSIGINNFDSIYEKLSMNETKYNENLAEHLSSVTNLSNDASNLERINRWVCAYRMYEDQPIFGFGPGSYTFVYDRFQTPEFMTRISTHDGDKGNAHSEYLTALSETGLLGFLLFTAQILYVFHTSLKLLYQSITKQDRLLILSATLGLITFYVHGLFNTFMDYDKIAILVYSSLGLLVIMDVKYSKLNDKQTK